MRFEIRSTGRHLWTWVLLDAVHMTAMESDRTFRSEAQASAASDFRRSSAPSDRAGSRPIRRAGTCRSASPRKALSGTRGGRNGVRSARGWSTSSRAQASVCRAYVWPHYWRMPSIQRPPRAGVQTAEWPRPLGSVRQP
ncbi:hypothetical protein CIW48_29430 [Methylobacterium sp. P1-11]|nr:hypothetical protein CIW48_29430 [Methylobacterium sp. P1-11]